MSFVFSQIISNYENGNFGKELVHFLLNDSFLENFLNRIESDDDISVLNIINLIMSLLYFCAHEESKANGMILYVYTYPEKHNLLNHENFINLLINKADIILTKLFENQNKEEILRTNGKRTKGFGLDRLKILDFVNLFLQFKREEFFKMLDFYNFYEKLLVKYFQNLK